MIASTPVRRRAGRTHPLAVLMAAAWLLCGCAALGLTEEPLAVGPTVEAGTGPADDAVGMGTDPGGGADDAGVASSAVPATDAPSSTTEASPPLPPIFAEIAARVRLSTEGRRLLAESSPELDDIASLADVCTLETDASVLGCYRSGRIAVLAVTDPRLDGMVEVTTAHEVLHAVWATYDRAEQERLGSLLRAAYQRVATPELADRIELYQQRDPESVDGELHSILGTEVADIGPELEEHYRRSFDDRSAVVALAAQVQTTFASLKAQVEELDRTLDALRADIGAREAALAAERASIDAVSAELDELLAAGQVEQYNARVEPFNQQIDRYNTSVAEVEQMITRFNDLAAERNALADDYSSLVTQITTTAETVGGT